MRLVLCLLLSATAWAEDPKRQLEGLSDELHKLRAQVPAAVDALHSLENRVEALQHEVERLSAAREADPFVQKAVDELRVQVDSLERRLAVTQLEIADAPAPSFKLGYDDGVYLETKPVRLQLNAAVMPRWIGTIRDGRSNDSTFELHHGQLALGGEILGWIDVQLMLDFGAEFWGDKISILRDAYLAVRPLPWLRIVGGQFKVPFSRQRLVSSLRQTFTERSLATRAFSFDRDLGGMLEFRIFSGQLLIQAAVTDGVRAGSAVKNDNLDFAYTLRLVGQPFGVVPLVEGDVARTARPRLSLGAAFQLNLEANSQGVDIDRDGVIDNVAVYSLDLELAFVFRGLAVEGEYFLRAEESGAGVPPRIYQGGYAQLSYLLWRGLQLGIRYSFAHPHTLGAAPLGIFGVQPRAAHEAGVVVGYWLWRQHVRAQIEYDYRHDLAPAIQQGHICQVQLQAGF